MRALDAIHVALIGLSSIVLTSCAQNAVPSRTSDKRLHVGAWITYWNYEKGMSTAMSRLDVLDDVFLFLAHLDSEGRPRLALSRTELADEVALLSRKARTWLTIVNDVVHDGTRPPDLKSSVRSAIQSEDRG